MAHVTPEKPSARAGAELIVSNGEDIGSAAADDFVIAVQRARFSYMDRNMTETTADGDGVVVYDESGFMWGRVILQGYMRAATAIGIQNLINATNNVLDFQYYLGGTQYLDVNGKVQRIEVTHGISAAIVGVMMDIVYSNQTVADVENNVV